MTVSIDPDDELAGTACAGDLVEGQHRWRRGRSPDRAVAPEHRRAIEQRAARRHHAMKPTPKVAAALPPAMKLALNEQVLCYNVPLLAVTGAVPYRLSADWNCRRPRQPGRRTAHRWW